MTTATHTQNKTAANTASNAATNAAAASAETMQNAFNETVKTSMGAAMKAMQIGLDAWTNGARTMFDGFAAATKSVAGMPMPAMPFALPTAGPASAHAAFEQMTHAMHGVVDANARFATECTALAVDAVRANARAVELMGQAMISGVAGWNAASTQGSGTKQPTATIDAVRAIVDDAVTFARTAGERLVAMQSEHAKLIAGIVDRSVRGATCCNGSAKA
jgi:hypothetical protein